MLSYRFEVNILFAPGSLVSSAFFPLKKIKQVIEQDASLTSHPFGARYRVDTIR